MGKAIHKTVSVAEIIKRRIPYLHQITDIGSTEIEEIYSPVSEGLEEVRHTKHVSSIQINLSLNPLPTDAVGYQAPLAPEQQGKSQINRPRMAPYQQNTGRGGIVGAGRGYANRRRGRGGFYDTNVNTNTRQFNANYQDDVRNNNRFKSISSFPQNSNFQFPNDRNQFNQGNFINPQQQQGGQQGAQGAQGSNTFTPYNQNVNRQNQRIPPQQQRPTYNNNNNINNQQPINTPVGQFNNQFNPDPNNRFNVNRGRGRGGRGRGRGRGVRGEYNNNYDIY
jgi:hypothetical protein